MMMKNATKLVEGLIAGSLSFSATTAEIDKQRLSAVVVVDVDILSNTHSKHSFSYSHCYAADRVDKF